MPLDLWGTVDLIEAQQDDRQAPPDGWWLQFFPTVFTSEAEEIYFDQLPDLDRRLAPFVAPHIQGRVMKAKGQAMAKFSPAYLKPKHVIDPSMAIPRMPGEPLLGNLSLEARFDRIVANRLATQRAMIERRWDWMAAMATIYGYVDVAGEDYTPVRVDFQRHASLTKVLTGTARWDQVDANPLQDFRDIRTAAFVLGKSSVRIIVFGVDAWAEFSSREDVKALMNTQFRGSESVLNITGFTDGQPVEFQGQISGPGGAGILMLYTYSNEYEDPVDGVMKQVLSPKDVVGIGGALQGVQCFGAIRDKRAGLRATNIFPKMYEQEDPSATYVLSQSAPLMVPRNVNNSFRMTVLS